MNQELANLISLQNIDNEINEIKSLAGDLPKKVSIKENRIEKSEFELSNLNEQCENTEKQIRKYNSENEDSHAKLSKYKDQLYLVKSNKEYDALNNEIDHLKNTISECDDKLVELELEKENNTASIETINSELKEIKEQLIKDKEQLKNALLSSEEDLKKHNLDRKTLIDKIDVKLLAKYNELSDRGSAVVTLNSNCCGNCFSVLPPQKIVEIKSNDLINLCTSCGVYVFFEE